MPVFSVYCLRRRGEHRIGERAHAGSDEFSIVMPGLVPGIHETPKPSRQLVDWPGRARRVAAILNRLLQQLLYSNADRLDFINWRRSSRRKHRRLRKGAGTAERLAPLVPGRLDDEMNVRRLPSCVGPQAHVHLVCAGDGLDGLRHALQEGTHFLSFRCGETADMETVAEGLDDQSTHSQRSGAVLHNPMLGSVDPPARKRLDALG